MIARRLAWALWAVTATLVTAEVFFAIQNQGREAGGSYGPVFDWLFRLGLMVFPTVGAFVATRRPENAVGWIMLGSGVLLALSGFAISYATYGLFTRPGGRSRGGCDGLDQRVDLPAAALCNATAALPPLP